MDGEVASLRYYMGVRVIGWIWIIAVLMVILYRFTSASVWSTIYESVTGTAVLINLTLVGLLLLGIIIEWYGSFRLFRIRRRLQPREEQEAQVSR